MDSSIYVLKNRDLEVWPITDILLWTANTGHSLIALSVPPGRVSKQRCMKQSPIAETLCHEVNVKLLAPELFF
jgi:hypothetical protein